MNLRGNNLLIKGRFISLKLIVICKQIVLIIININERSELLPPEGRVSFHQMDLIYKH